MFQKLEHFTKEELLYERSNPRRQWMTKATPNGEIRSLDFLTSDGYWVHVEDGVVR